MPGDVILGYNGQAIKRSGDLPALVGMSQPGSKATLTVWRGGKKIELGTTLKAADAAVASTDPSANKSTEGRLGVAVRALTAEEKNQTSLAGGVLVEQSAGAAARAGIQAGDIILAVNGTPVKSVTQLQTMIAARSHRLAVLIQRGDAQLFIPVAVG